MDPMRTDQEALWQAMRGVDPPAGARARVLEGIERSAQRGPRRGWLYAGAGLAAAAAALALVWSLQAPAARPHVVAVAGGFQSQAALVAGTTLGPEEVVIEARGRIEMDLPKARVEVSGPARLAAAGDRVKLSEGRLTMSGAAEVQAPTCTAAVDGRCQVVVSRQETLVTVFAGTAEVSPQAGCRVIYSDEQELAARDDERAERSDDNDVVAAVPDPNALAAGEEPDDDAETDEADADTDTEANDDARATLDTATDRSRRTRRARGRQRAAAPTPSQLAKQVGEFERAMATADTQPGRTLTALRAFRRSWPNSPLAHEADLAIFEVLTRLDHQAAADRAGRSFLRRYPKSPKAAQVRARLPDKRGDRD